MLLLLAGTSAGAASPLVPLPRSAPPQGSVPPPPAPHLMFTGFVVDQAQVLTPSQNKWITGKLDRLQQHTGRQMVVVTITSLGGQDIAAFTTALFNRWGVGRRGYNDGVVILVAPNEHKARIAVGLGLEQLLDDDYCTDVMKAYMIPHFARDDMAGGIETAVDVIGQKLVEAAASGDGKAAPGR